MGRNNVIAVTLAGLVSACGGIDPELEPMTAGLAVSPAALESAERGPEELARRVAVAVEPRDLNASADKDVRYPHRMPARLPCPMGLALCGGDCVDLSFDPDNCGGCGFSCATPYCAAGRCVDQQVVDRQVPWVTP